MESSSSNSHSSTLHPGVVERAEPRWPTREWCCWAMEVKWASCHRQRYLILWIYRFSSLFSFTSHLLCDINIVAREWTRLYAKLTWRLVCVLFYACDFCQIDTMIWPFSLDSTPANGSDSSTTLSLFARLLYTYTHTSPNSFKSATIVRKSLVSFMLYHIWSIDSKSSTLLVELSSASFAEHLRFHQSFGH